MANPCSSLEKIRSSSLHLSLVCHFPLSRDFLIYIVTAQVLLRLPCGGDFIGVALAS